MAKKKAENPPMQTTVDEPKTKPVRLDLPPDVHKMLRVVSADNEKPMAVFARELVEKAVRELHGRRVK